jgi:hypothetical protein
MDIQRIAAMATDLQRAKTAPAARKHEAFVEAQLARARTRIRCLDLAAAGLGLVILTFVYGLVLALCDRWLELPALARQIAFGLYAAGGLVYLGFFVLWPLWRPINPYYAAQRLERTIPEAKNSVVNWLDLHQQAIAPAFRSAIGQQAARDLADADVEQAISARRTSWLGGATGALFVCVLILYVLGRDQFVSLVTRAFAPFVEASIATRTRIVLEKPAEGDITIPLGRAVEFGVQVEGRVPATSSPEALRLLYRYNRSDPYQTRLLERGESRQWVTKLLASEVHNGFWYKVAGGDTETAEYRVGVRSTPLFTGFDVTYHYRPYLGWPDRTTHDQNLEDLRGTEVTLLARTNRVLKTARLEIDGQQTVAAELVPEDPQAMRFRLRLDAEGSYRIWFRSTENEDNIDPMAYTIRVLQDRPPQVELTKPGENVELPANGVLNLEGSASDDFGVASLNLRMKIEDGATLQPKPYRKAEALRRGDGSYPQMLAYRDFLELDKLQQEDGKPLEPLPVGAKIEYWLEAIDNCDYPGPNTGESKHFTVTIRAADADQKKQEQNRQETRQEQQKHEKKQDQDLQNQKRDAREKSQEQNSRAADTDQQNKEGGQQDEDQLNQQKEKIENAIKQNEQQQKGSGKGEAKGEQNQESKGEAKGDASSGNQVDKAQDKGKESGDAASQPGQAKSDGKPDANTPKGERKGDAFKSEGNRDKQGDQQGTERSTEQTEGNKDSGANHPGTNSQRQPKPSGEGQAPDPATSQSGKGEKSTKPESRNAEKEQNTGRSQEKGRGEGQSEEKAAKPNAGQETGEKPGGEQNASQEQQSSPKSGDQKSQSKQDASKQTNAGAKTEPGAQTAEKKNAGQEGPKQDSVPSKAEERAGKQQEKKGSAGDNMKQDAGTEKGEKNGPGQDGPKKDAGQGKADQKQDAPKKDAGQGKADQTQGRDAEKTQKQNSERGAGSQQGEKKENVNSSQQGASETRPGEKRESSTDPQARPKQDQASGSKGDRTSPSTADKQNPDVGKRENAAKAQDKPMGPDKSEAGDGGAAKAEKKNENQNPPPRGTAGTDKTEDRSASSDRREQSKQEAAKKSQDDISAVSDALKSRDEKARANARKRLEELRDKAPDESVRRGAADALDRDNAAKREPRNDAPRSAAEPDRSEEKAAKGREDGTGQEKGRTANPRPATQNGDKGGTDPSNPAKNETKNGDRTKPQGDSESPAKERGNQTTSSKKPGGSGASSGPGGNEPTPEQPNSSLDDQPKRTPDAIEPPTSADAGHQKRAGELQLEDIKKKINKDVLKQLNMTEEEFQKFAKAYEEMLKRKQSSGPDKENVAAPQRGNRSLPNQSTRLVDPLEQSRENKLQRLGPTFAPPEFREAYKQFSKHISDLEQTKEKK